MKTSDFDYHLPVELIAQTPVEPRDRSRLMVVNRGDGSIEHRGFADIVDYLNNGDVLVFNDSRVIPARLYGRKVGSGGRVEILLLRHAGDDGWEALVKPGKRVSVGARVEIASADDGYETGVIAEVRGVKEGGIRVLTFSRRGAISGTGQGAAAAVYPYSCGRPRALSDSVLPCRRQCSGTYRRFALYAGAARPFGEQGRPMPVCYTPRRA